MTKPQNFNVTVGRDAFTVSVTDEKISATSSLGHWVFNRRTKLPESFERPSTQNDPIYYSVDTRFSASQGLGAVTAVDGMGVVIPRHSNGVGSLPIALDAIRTASSKHGFPQNAKDIIPDLYTNLGLPLPQRSRP